MNPIEQIWKEIRKRGFRNEVFATLEKVVLRLCDTISSLFHSAILLLYRITPTTKKNVNMTGNFWSFRAGVFDRCFSRLEKSRRYHLRGPRPIV